MGLFNKSSSKTPQGMMRKATTQAKQRRFFQNADEDKWFCWVLIFLIVGFIAMIIWSQQMSNEKYQKSDYFRETNNYLYQIQQEKGMAVTLTFKSRAIKRHQNISVQFNQLFNQVRNQSKTHNLEYIPIRYMKNEILFKMRLSNQTDLFDHTFKEIADKFIKTLKRNSKTLVIEYQYFNNSLNPKGKPKTHMLTGSSTKMKDTLDYRMKFHSIEYQFMEKPVKGEKLKEIEELTIDQYTQIEEEDELEIERSVISEYCSVTDYFMDHRKILQPTDEL